MAERTNIPNAMFDDLGQAVLAQRIDNAARQAVRRIFFTGPNGGGTGKTSISDALASLARLAGYQPLLFDADPTLRGLRTQVGRNHATDLPAAFDLPYLDEIKAMAAGRAHVFMDVGASGFLLPGLGNGLLSIMKAFDQQGWQCVLLACLIPNKPGLTMDALNFINLFGAAGVEIRLVLTDTDGSADFGEHDTLIKTYPSIRVPHVQAGLRRLIASNDGLLANLLQHPPAHYKRASGWLASHLLEIASQASVQSLIDCTPAIEGLRQAARHTPNWCFNGLGRLEQLTDAALTADETFLEVQAKLREQSEHTADGRLLPVSRQYLQTWHRRLKA